MSQQGGVQRHVAQRQVQRVEVQREVLVDAPRRNRQRGLHPGTLRSAHVHASSQGRVECPEFTGWGRAGERLEELKI